MSWKDRNEEHRRTRERRALLRQHLPAMLSKALCAAAMSPRRSAELLRSVGVDVARYGDLLEPRRGGPPKTTEPRAVLRQTRYAYLRAAGLPGLEATHRAQSQPQFEWQVRKLRAEGWVLPPLPPEIAGTLDEAAA